MSLHPGAIPPVPEETRRMAPAAFPRGNLYMRLRDELGAIYDDHLFASLFPARASRRRRRVRRWQRPPVLRVATSYRRWRRQRTCLGCVRSRPSRHCGRSGPSSTPTRRGRCGGVR